MKDRNHNALVRLPAWLGDHQGSLGGYFVIFQKDSMQAKSPLRLLAEIADKNRVVVSANLVHVSPTIVWRSENLSWWACRATDGWPGANEQDPSADGTCSYPIEWTLKVMILCGCYCQSSTYQGRSCRATATLTVSPRSSPFSMAWLLEFLRSCPPSWSSRLHGTE